MRWLLTSLLMIWPLAASAAPVTWVFTGEVSAVMVGEPAGSPGSIGVLSSLGVSLGAPFAGSYTFESTTPDQEPSPSGGSYPGALLSLNLQIGSISFTRQPSTFNGIGVAPGSFVPYNALEFVNLAPSPFSTNVNIFQLALLDSDGDLLASDLLPLVPPDLALADPHDPQDFVIEGVVSGLALVLTDGPGGGQIWVTGELFTLQLPEPGLGLLVGLGALGVFARRRLASIAS